MGQMTLVIGNKNYSSWSLRPWAVMEYFKIPFQEILIPLYEDGSKEKILKYSPSGKVPILKDGKLTVWDTLSICEYLAEKFPKKNLWPKDKAARAAARSVCAEMHSGFSGLRKNCPLDVRALKRDFVFPEDARKDAERIIALWQDCRQRFGKNGEFLFGNFSIADAFYAPVVWRFYTYNIKLTNAAQKYFEAILDLPLMKQWQTAALKEPWIIHH